MLKQTKQQLARLEQRYRGITKQIMFFENATLPPCPRCGSNNTADVQVGIIGRTINISAATTKFKLIANGPKPGAFACNDCRTFFDQQTACDDEPTPQAPGGFTLACPNDRSLATFKRWVTDIAAALGRPALDDVTEADWEEQWQAFWSATAS